MCYYSKFLLGKSTKNMQDLQVFARKKALTIILKDSKKSYSQQ